MSDKKTVIYPISEDHIGRPKEFVNENKHSLASKISLFTKIDPEKIFKALNKYPEDIRKFEDFTNEELNKIEDIFYLLSFL
ncbi:MAG TPA: hypothetical protein GXX73_14145 [Clostridium sp.]|nr:hypothetical protein [Clostridium sp.]